MMVYSLTVQYGQELWGTPCQMTRERRGPRRVTLITTCSCRHKRLLASVGDVEQLADLRVEHALVRAAHLEEHQEREQARRREVAGWMK